MASEQVPLPLGLSPETLLALSPGMLPIKQQLTMLED